MLFMVIERFIAGPEPVYARVAEIGRVIPEGLKYVSSWIAEPKLDLCYQIMETDADISLEKAKQLLEEWAANWKGLAEFEFVPVVTSPEAAKRVKEGQFEK